MPVLFSTSRDFFKEMVLRENPGICCSSWVGRLILSSNTSSRLCSMILSRMFIIVTQLIFVNSDWPFRFRGCRPPRHKHHYTFYIFQCNLRPLRHLQVPRHFVPMCPLPSGS